MLKLYDYFRSSACWRVRIALALKGLAYEKITVDIHPGRLAQLDAGYGAIHPQRLVPVLEDGGIRLTQSLAIIEYLEETRPGAARLLPARPVERARARAVALAVACEIHSLQNQRTTRRLGELFGADQAVRDAWNRDWIAEGLASLEAMLSAGPGPFALGSEPGLAEAFLVPQIYNARRYGADLEPMPALRRIEAACLALPAFRDTAPEAVAVGVV